MIAVILTASLALSIAPFTRPPVYAAQHPRACPVGHAKDRSTILKLLSEPDLSIGGTPLRSLRAAPVRVLISERDAAVCTRLNELLSYYEAPEFTRNYYAVGDYYVVVIRAHPRGKRSSEFIPVIVFDSAVRPLRAFSS